MTEPEIPFVAALRGEVQRSVIAETADPARDPQHVSGVLGSLRLRRRVSALSAGGATVVAAATAAAIIALGAGGTDPAPAYAVTVNNNAITIHWNEWTAISELNARLAAMSMRIRVVPIVPGCVAPVHVVVYAHAAIPTHVAPGPAKTIEVFPLSQPTEAPAVGGELTTWNDTLIGRTRIFTATRSGGWDGGVFTVVGPAPPCVGDGG